MKKLIYVLLLLSSLLVLNIAIYFLSSDYRFYVKKLKYWELPVEENQIITDNYSIENSKNCDCSNNENVLSNTWVLTSSWELTWTWESTASTWWIETLSNYFSWIVFTPKTYDEYFKIFDITDEYINKYETYVSENIEIYYFPESNFDELYGFFETISFEFPITLNRLNNFWQRSFYVNKKENDDFVRLVIKYDNKIFWLKIKNNYYNEARKILNQL